jgi:hypothetical protein
MKFTESGMTFEFNDELCFQIEKNKVYQAIQAEGIKVAECLLLRKNQLWIIEAKKTSPQQTTQPHFDEYIEEIKTKFIHSLTLFNSIYIQRYNNDELPTQFKQLNLSQIEPVFVLIIKNHQQNWLQPLKDELHRQLKLTAKLWNLKGVWIRLMNEKLAQEAGLILLFQE